MFRAVVFAANSAAFNPSGQLANDDTYFPSKGQHDLRQKVADIYEDFVSGNQGPRVTAVLAEVVGSHLGEEPSRNWAFTAVVIRQLESSVEFGFVELSVGKAGSPLENVNHWERDHVATLMVSNFHVYAPILQVNVDRFAEVVHKVTIADFIKFFTTVPSKGRLEAWLEAEQSQDTDQRPITRRHNALYPRM
ncbi:unnamed protein product [Mortierella alpina]